MKKKRHVFWKQGTTLESEQTEGASQVAAKPPSEKKTTEFPSEKEEEKSIKAQTLMDSGWCC
ncbi:hypothetical protein HKD37_10G027208 [Glycine soja]